MGKLGSYGLAVDTCVSQKASETKASPASARSTMRGLRLTTPKKQLHPAKARGVSECQDIGKKTAEFLRWPIMKVYENPSYPPKLPTSDK